MLHIFLHSSSRSTHTFRSLQPFASGSLPHPICPFSSSRHDRLCNVFHDFFFDSCFFMTALVCFTAWRRSYGDVTLSSAFPDWFGLQARRTLVVFLGVLTFYGPPVGSHRHTPKSSSGALLRLCSSLRLGEHPLQCMHYWDGIPQLSGAGPLLVSKGWVDRWPWWSCHISSMTKKTRIIRSQEKKKTRSEKEEKNHDRALLANWKNLPVP